MSKIKGIIYFQDYIQTSPDDFQGIAKTLEVDENTTIGEIVEWQDQAISRGSKRPDGHVHIPTEMRLTFPSPIPKKK